MVQKASPWSSWSSMDKRSGQDLELPLAASYNEPTHCFPACLSQFCLQLSARPSPSLPGWYPRTCVWHRANCQPSVWHRANCQHRLPTWTVTQSQVHEVKDHLYASPVPFSVFWLLIAALIVELALWWNRKPRKVKLDLHLYWASLLAIFQYRQQHRGAFLWSIRQSFA